MFNTIVKNVPWQVSERLKIICVRIYRKFTNRLILALQFFFFKRTRKIEKILVFRTGSIGDSICAMPAIFNIRKHFPDANIQLLTNAGKGYQNLVSMEAMIAPGIFDNIINYENLTRGELTKQLRSNKYDLVIQLPQYGSVLMSLLRDMIYFRYVVNIPYGFGWQYDNIPFFRRSQEHYRLHIDERSRLNNILSRNGIIIQPENYFPFHINSKDHLKIDEILNSWPSGSKPLLAVVVGAKRSQNRWPLAHFSVVIQHFCSEYRIVLLGGPEDEDLVRPLLNWPNTYSVCGKISPVQSGLLMKCCRLVLSNDTGPMHLSYAFGTPVVALFSNRDFSYRWFPPENGYNAVFRATDVECSLCLSENCSNNICMQKIEPQDVIAQMEAILQVLPLINRL